MSFSNHLYLMVRGVCYVVHVWYIEAEAPLLGTYRHRTQRLYIFKNGLCTIPLLGITYLPWKVGRDP